MASQTVVSKGIFHGLPTFPECDGKKLSIIVTGANGISGSAMVKVLSEAPARWDKIYALSRRPGTYPASSNIVSIAVDFLDSTPEAIAKVLKDHHVKADYVYFASYVQPPPGADEGLWSNIEDLTKQNVALLTNFLNSLPLASIKPKRVLLQTGAKYYGLHLGPTSTPMDEADPRHGIEGVSAPTLYTKECEHPSVLHHKQYLERPELEPLSAQNVVLDLFPRGPRFTFILLWFPIDLFWTLQYSVADCISRNFYFPQEDFLYEYSRNNDSTWVVTRPCFILGAVETAAMNIVYPLSIYAAVQAHLSRALEFPGDIPAWDAEKHQSTAILIAYHAEWALLTPDAGNMAFNHSDSSMFSWGKFWPTLADWYHIPAGRPATDPAAYATITLPYKTSPRGFGGPGVVKPSFSFLEWSKDPEVLKAWEELKAKHGLKDSPFGERARETFGLIDGEILGGWGRVVAMDRSRKLGWHGYVDTKEAIKGVIDDMAKLKIVPPLK